MYILTKSMAALKEKQAKKKKRVTKKLNVIEKRKRKAAENTTKACK